MDIASRVLGVFLRKRGRLKISFNWIYLVLYEDTNYLMQFRGKAGGRFKRPKGDS